MNRRAVVLAAICLATLLTLAVSLELYPRPTAPVERTSGPILPYEGRFVEERAYRNLAGELPRLIDRAVHEAATGLGLSADPSRVRLRLVDDASGAAWTERFIARTLVGSHGPAVIELRLEPLLAGRVDIEATLTHEAAHAVLASALGQGYARIPEWLREGIAVDVAGETEFNLSRAISLTSLRPVEKIAYGLFRTDHAASDYGESGLAIETLRSLAGEDALPRLVSCLSSDGVWRDCLRDLTGLEPGQFEARALIDALTVIGTLAGDRVSRYESARALLRDGDAAGALAGFESLLESGEGPFDREARLASARALALLDRPEEALDQCETLLRMGDYGPDLGMQALTLQADVSRRTGLHARADAVCRKLLLYYSRAETGQHTNLEPSRDVACRVPESSGVRGY